MMINRENIYKALADFCKEKGYERFDLKTVMFDMDGVLFDSMPNHASSWHKAMTDFGLDLSEAEAFMHEGRTGSGTINIVSQRQFGKSVDEATCQKIYKRKSEYFSQCPTAQRMPGAYESVCNVKATGVTPIIITGSGTQSLLDRIETNFPNLFHHEWMVCAKDVKLGKPNPEPYLMGLKKAGNLSPSNSIIIENAPLGVQAGHAANCFVVAVNTGPLPDEALLNEGANILFHSMTELSENIITLINEANNLNI